MDEASSRRIYDAKIARFLQADPVVDGVTNTQGYNRYSYLHNNPLNATDPSGFSSWTKFRDRVLKPAAVIVLSVVTYGAASAWAVGLYGASCTVVCSIAAAKVIGGIAGAAAAGFVGGSSAAAFSGANGREAFKAGVIGAVSGAVFAGIGSSFSATSGFFQAGGAAHIGAHAITGGVLSELQGGKFGHGFASAGLTKAFMSHSGFDYSDGSSGAIAARTIIASVVGGTVSEMTGGKFANGAITAAMAHLFNQEKTESDRRDMISALEKERLWLASLSPEETEAYFKMGGLTGDSALARLKLQMDIRKQLLNLKGEGIANAISGTPGETAAGAFGAITSDLPGKAGLPGAAAGLWSNYKAIVTINDLSNLFGSDNVKYSATYKCASSCSLMVKIQK